MQGLTKRIQRADVCTLPLAKHAVVERRQQLLLLLVWPFNQHRTADFDLGLKRTTSLNKSAHTRQMCKWHGQHPGYHVREDTGWAFRGPRQGGCGVTHRWPVLSNNRLASVLTSKLTHERVCGLPHNMLSCLHCEVKRLPAATMVIPLVFLCNRSSQLLTIAFDMNDGRVALMTLPRCAWVFGHDLPTNSAARIRRHSMATLLSAVRHRFFNE